MVRLGPSHCNRSYLDGCVLSLGFPAYQFVRFHYGNNFLHPGHQLQILQLAYGTIAYRTDHNALYPPNQLGLEAQLIQLCIYRLDLLNARRHFHHYYHLDSS